MSPLARRVGSTAIAATLSLATFGGIAAFGFSQSGETAEASTSVRPDPHPSAPSDSIVVAYVLGQSGSDTGDVFAPYEVLASSPELFVYTVAATSDPAPVGGGMAVVPSYTFADVASGVAPKPNLIVVPAVNSPSGPAEEAARDFIVEQYASGAQVLGICAGSRLLAASGILDGRTATSHWSRISALEESNPEVTWVRGERYVQDGRITTSGGVTSGIPAALKVMADMAGDAEARRVGKGIDYPGWSLGAPTGMPAQSFGVADVPVLLNAVFPWARPSIAIELRDGVSEIDAGALFEVYSYSQAARATAHSVTGRVTLEHGLVVTTANLEGVRGELLVAGQLDTSSHGGFDAAFEQLSRITSPAVVASVGRMLEYPLDRITPEDAPLLVEARPGVLTVLGLALSGLVGALPALIRRARKRIQ